MSTHPPAEGETNAMSIIAELPLLRWVEPVEVVDRRGPGVHPLHTGGENAWSYPEDLGYKLMPRVMRAGIRHGGQGSPPAVR